jgi:hypothetical protein
VSRTSEIFGTDRDAASFEVLAAEDALVLIDRFECNSIESRQPMLLRAERSQTPRHDRPRFQFPPWLLARVRHRTVKQRVGNK